MDLQQLGKNISHTRRSLNLTQETVAFDLNISTTAYCKIERGETNVSFNRLLQIANYFKIPIDTLVREKDDINEDSMTRIYNELSDLRKDISFIVNSIKTKD